MLRSLQATWASGRAIGGYASDDVILVPAQACVSQPLLRACPATALTSEVKALLSECVAGLQGPRRPHPGDLETWAMCYLWCSRGCLTLDLGQLLLWGNVYIMLARTFAGLCDLGLCWDSRAQNPPTQSHVTVGWLTLGICQVFHLTLRLVMQGLRAKNAPTRAMSPWGG